MNQKGNILCSVNPVPLPACKAVLSNFTVSEILNVCFPFIEPQLNFLFKVDKYLYDFKLFNKC